MRKLVSLAVSLTLVLWLSNLSLAGGADLKLIVSGLSSPVFATNAHDGTNRMFILEQAGVIKVLQPGGTTPTVFLDIRNLVLSGGEQGLLGLAFHPQYPATPKFYVDYTRAGDGSTVIAEYQVSSDPNVASSSERTLLVIAQPYANHNGGMLAFGPDRYLYIGMGDGGSSFDPGNRAQDIQQLLGKILRIDVDNPNGPVPYSSPATNPFYGPINGADEIFAYGLRNPWRFSFDRITGDLYIGDVGQNEIEEVDIGGAGRNYGWRVWEGDSCTGLSPDPGCSGTGYSFPVVVYSHTSGRCSITGGYVYRGPGGNLPSGSYVFGDYCSGEIFLLQNGGMSVLLDTTLNISSFAEDETGELYVVALGGAIYQITAPLTCTYAIAPSTATFGKSGGSGVITVSAPAGCSWTAVANDSWLHVISGNSGSGNGTVSYSVDAYTLKRKSHSGTLTVAGKTFTVKQSR